MQRLALLVAVTACLALLGVLEGAALAHERTIFDRDDSPGPLDLAAARHRHRVLIEDTTHPPSSRRFTELSFRLVTFEGWTRDVLSANRNFISIEFQTDTDDNIDRCLVFTAGEHELLAGMYKRCRYSDDPLVGTASASRPDDHSVHVAFPRRLLGRGVRAYAWRAVSSYEDQAQESPCPAPTLPKEGGYGACTDVTRWTGHRA